MAGYISRDSLEASGLKPVWDGVGRASERQAETGSGVFGRVLTFWSSQQYELDESCCL